MDVLQSTHKNTLLHCIKNYRISTTLNNNWINIFQIWFTLTKSTVYASNSHPKRYRIEAAFNSNSILNKERSSNQLIYQNPNLLAANRILQNMKRPSILKTERRRSPTEFNRGQSRLKRFGLRKLRNYIPHTRVEKLKSSSIPMSTPLKLVIVSNYEGNGFRNHTNDIEMFDTGYEIKQQIKQCVKKLNQETYKAWKSKKTPLQDKKFKFQQGLMYFKMFLLLILMLAFLQMGGSQTKHPRIWAISIFVLIIVIVFGSIVIGLCSVFKKYQQNSLDTDIKNVVRTLLSKFNSDYFVQRKLIWKTHVDYLWVSLNQIDNSEICSSENSHSAKSDCPRKQTQQGLNSG